MVLSICVGYILLSDEVSATLDLGQINKEVLNQMNELSDSSE